MPPGPGRPPTGPPCWDVCHSRRTACAGNCTTPNIASCAFWENLSKLPRASVILTICGSWFVLTHSLSQSAVLGFQYSKINLSTSFAKTTGNCISSLSGSMRMEFWRSTSCFLESGPSSTVKLTRRITLSPNFPLRRKVAGHSPCDKAEADEKSLSESATKA